MFVTSVPTGIAMNSRPRISSYHFLEASRSCTLIVTWCSPATFTSSPPFLTRQPGGCLLDEPAADAVILDGRGQALDQSAGRSSVFLRFLPLSSRRRSPASAACAFHSMPGSPPPPDTSSERT